MEHHDRNPFPPPFVMCVYPTQLRLCTLLSDDGHKIILETLTHRAHHEIPYS